MNNATKIKCTFSYLFVIFLLGCKSNKEVRQLSSQVNCDKKVYFVWDNESNLAKFEKRGNYKDSYASFWKGKKLNYKDIFIVSISEINRKNKGNFIYTENPGFPSDSVIIVSVKLKKEVWNMGFSKLITDMQFVYSTNNKKFNIIGSSIGYKGEKRALNCFENANLKFLIANCNE